MRLRDGIEYVRVWWVAYDHPSYRDHIADPPLNGWSGAIVLSDDGGLEEQPPFVTLFCPVTLQSFRVSPDCPELRDSKEPARAPNEGRLRKRLIENWIERDSLGMGSDWATTRRVIEALGGEAPPLTRAYDPVESKPKAERPKSEKAKAREGLTGVAEIAGELGMTAKEARTILRRIQQAKPEAGWVWPVNEVETIKDILHKNRD